MRHFSLQVAAVRRTGVGWSRAARKVISREPGFWGGQVSHFGLALAAVAIATSSGIAVRQPVTLAEGESVVVDDYCVEYLRPFTRIETNRSVSGVEVALMRADCATPVKVMQPRLNHYPHADQAVATPDVRTGFVDDVYLSLSSLTSGGTVSLDVFVFPLMWLLWFGGAVAALGGFMALGARRRTRENVERVSTAT